MLSVTLARELRAAGLEWAPASGDRFVVDQADMLDDVFVLSDMTVQTHQLPTGLEIRFNGTTEWALDSVSKARTVWLPYEHQLRDALGGSFLRLEHGAGRHRVVLGWEGGAGERSYDADSAAEAYGRALLEVLRERAAASLRDPG